jgi:hypothetical protein
MPAVSIRCALTFPALRSIGQFTLPDRHGEHEGPRTGPAASLRAVAARRALALPDRLLPRTKGFAWALAVDQSGLAVRDMRS